MSLAGRLLAPIVEIREAEARPLLLMFAYSFLVMTSYNIVKPLTRAQFIDELGAENLPWVLLGSGVLVGVLMHAYSLGVARLPPRSVLATTQIMLGGLLFLFWPLFVFGVPGTSVGFYLVGQVLGLLLISQFWMLANDIYDARQAKRLFGFIGGGASLGGVTGSAIVAFTVERVGTTNLLIVSGTVLIVCAGVVTAIIRLSKGVQLGAARPATRSGVGGREALRLLGESRHLQRIALIIGLGAIGAGLLEQQLNMAVEDVQSAESAEAIAAFLGAIQLYLSVAGFVIQVWLTGRIHRRLGVGFAMLILPIGLGSTGGLILVTGALWAAAAGRIIDSSLRYTVDKTTREILFLPLPHDLKHRAKPFIDVTVDRFARGIGAAVTLVLIQPWGLNLDWHQLSWVSLTVTGVWIVSAVNAHRQYLTSFRKSLIQRNVAPSDFRLPTADLSTIEALIEELSEPDDRRVLYAIEVLESLDKRHLVTPLLLHHDSAAVRKRALEALATARTSRAHLVPSIERLVTDPSAPVRAAAVAALASVRGEDAEVFARRLVHDRDASLVVTAAVVLAASTDPRDRQIAERALATVASDPRGRSSAVRRDLAAAVGQVGNPRAHHLLIPLLHDPDPTVAEEAMRSIAALDVQPALFTPALISLLGHRRLKSDARTTLVHFGEPVVDVLRHYLSDPDEQIWVRRHIPATLARIPCQMSMDILTAALDTDDGFLRFKALSAIEKLHREHPELRLSAVRTQQLVLVEGRSYFRRLCARYQLFDRAGLPASSLLAQALDDKLERSVDRIYRLLGLLHPWRDIVSVRWSIEHGNARARASALEYLDNILPGGVRTCLVPVLEDTPVAEKVRQAHAVLGTRPATVREILGELIRDGDEVVAAAAIDLVGAQGLEGHRAEVDQILANPGAGRPHVAEAAAGTQATRAMTPEERRDRRRRSPSTAVIVERLRRVDLFATVWIDELFRIATAGHLRSHSPGVLLCREGVRPDQMHLLLDGDAEARTAEGLVRSLTAPVVLGFEEALDAFPMPESITTTTPAVTLSLSPDELLSLLADNSDLVQALLRSLVLRHGSTLDVMTDGPVPWVDRFPTDGRTASVLERGLVLRCVPLFASLSGEEMLHLAVIAEPRLLEVGQTLTEDGSGPALAFVLSGDLQPQDKDGNAAGEPVRAGYVVGLHETLTATPGPAAHRVVATTASTVLRIERDDLFDLLGQRPNLLGQIFSALLGRRDGDQAAISAPGSETRAVSSDDHGRNLDTGGGTP